MRKVGIAAALGLTPLLLLARPGQAADTPTSSPAINLAQAFGAREYVQQISLSPDGTKIAYIAPSKGRGATLSVIDTVKADEKVILTSTGSPDRLTDCHWSTDTRLICGVFMILNGDRDREGFTRIVAINADGSGIKELSARASSRAFWEAADGGSLVDWGGNGTGSALMTRDFVPEETTGSIVGKTHSGLGVELVDTISLSRKTVEQPREGAFDYIADGQGNVRIMGLQSTTGTGYDGKKITYMYRQAGGRDWKQLDTLTVEGFKPKGFYPVAVDPTLNVAYGFDNESGRTSLYSIALDGTLTRKLVFSSPSVDVDGLIQIGRRARVVGVSYATDKRQAEYFDPQLKALRTALGRALPGKMIEFIDSSLDESKLLLYANSDVDPGTYYLFDRSARKLSPIMPARPPLANIPLAAVKSITYKAADGTDIPAYLTLPVGSNGKNLPAIVMPHGGPASRDEWGFDWLPQFFVAKGYAVIQPEYRGSAGYGDAWFQRNGYQSWRTAIGDVDDAGRWLIKAGIADPKKLAIVGWSYGGYAALQSSALDSDLFKAIVAIAPVTDLETLRQERFGYTDFPQRDAQIGHGPWVAEGSPARNVDRIKAPVLLFHGDLDRNVGVGESRLMADRLKSAGKKIEYVEFKGLDHQLEDSTVRAQMLDKAAAFLRAAMGM